MRHLAAARYFEALGDDELAGVLATHYLDAYRASPEGAEGDAVAIQARIALRAAADRAAALHSNEQALAYLEHALTVTTDPAERAALLERAGAAAQATARFDSAQQFLLDAMGIYREIGDRVSLVRVAAASGLALAVTGGVEEAIALLDPMLDEFADLDGDPSFVGLISSAARAHALHDDNARAMELADRALVAAERLDLVSIIADSVMTKGVALAYVGRSREAAILMSGVLGLAEEYGLITAELRAHLNMSQFLFPDDPRAGLASALAGLERARKFGLGDWALLLTGNAAAAAIPAGEWDWILAAREEVGGEASDGATIEAVGWSIVVKALRGDSAAAKAGALTIDEMTEVSSDPQNAAYRSLLRAWIAYAAGDFGSALGATSDPFVDVTVTYRVYVLAGRSALALGDVDRAKTAHADTVQIGVHGRWASASLATLQAGITALEGRTTEAIAAYGEAARAWRALELPFELGLCLLEFATFVGVARREARAAADEARTIFETLGATPLTARVVERPCRGGPGGASQWFTLAGRLQRGGDRPRLRPVRDCTSPHRTHLVHPHESTPYARRNRTTTSVRWSSGLPGRIVRSSRMSATEMPEDSTMTMVTTTLDAVEKIERAHLEAASRFIEAIVEHDPLSLPARLWLPVLGIRAPLGPFHRALQRRGLGCLRETRQRRPAPGPDKPLSLR